MAGNLSLKLNQLPHWLIVILSIFAIALCVFIDIVTGSVISVEFLYFVPVVFVTWYASRNVGYAISVLATISIIGVDYSSHYNHLHPIYALWNGLIKLLPFFAVVYLVTKVRVSLAFEKSLARTDSLTGVSNRLTFSERMDSYIYQAERSNEPFTLAYIDVDSFKYINDNYGHDVGDDVLRLLASTIHDSLRRTDFVARLGGDEFAVLLMNTDRAGARSLVDKMMTALQEAFQLKSSAVTFSVGAVTFETSPESTEKAINIADALMYEVKRNGKNSVRFSVFNNAQLTKPSHE